MQCKPPNLFTAVYLCITVICIVLITCTALYIFIAHFHQSSFSKSLQSMVFTHINAYIYQGNIRQNSIIYQQVFGVWEETGVPGGGCANSMRVVLRYKPMTLVLQSRNASYQVTVLCKAFINFHTFLCFILFLISGYTWKGNCCMRIYPLDGSIALFVFEFTQQMFLFLEQHQEKKFQIFALFNQALVQFRTQFLQKILVASSNKLTRFQGSQR